jgi:hypothetical protein
VEEYAACDKCGLKVVRYELERRGIVLRFCDMCYWGEVGADGRPACGNMEGKRGGSPTPGEGPSVEILTGAEGTA